MVVSSDEVRAAIDKAAKKIAEERAKKAKQAQQNQQGQQATQQTQQTQTTQQTQGEKDLNTIKIPDALKGSATLKDINSRYKYTTPEGKTVMQTEGQQLQEAIDKKQRQTGWEKFKKTGKDLITGVKEIGKSLWSEYVSNTDKEKGILDYDKYQMYQDEMLSDSTTQEQRNKIMDKMESEGVIDRDTYNSWVQNQVKAQEKDVDYEINKVKEEQKNDFREQLKQVVQPYVEQADNHYQIDAYTNAIDRLMKQYEMLYDNVVETYDDTRNTRILGARDQYGYKLQDDIKTFLGDWSKHISEGMTDSEAYKETIKNNQEVANRIVDYERAITDMQYQVTIHDNFSKEGNVGGTILSQATNAILGVSNLITLGITNYVTNPLEEAKQLTGYYDIVEELANLNIKDEADGWLKRGYKSVGSFIRSLYDAAPTLIPSIGSLFLAGKISKAAEGVEKVKEAAVGAKGLSGIVKGGLKGVELFGVELTNDMILLDTTFQTALGRPITREDAVWNMIPNFILDAVSAKSMSRPVKEYLTNIPRGEIMKNVVKKELVDKLSGMKDYGKMVDYFYHYKSLEIANGLEDTGKTIDLNDLAKTDPDLAGKVKAVQIGAAEFPDKVISGNITEKQLFQLVLEKLHKERQSALLQKVANEMSDAPKTTTKVGKTTTKKAATQAQNITKEVDDIMDESDLLSTVMKNNKISTEIKFISSTVKGLVASGLVDAKTVASMVKTASNGNQGVYDFMMGVLVSGEQGKTYLKRGIAYFDNVQKELGNSLLYTQSQLQEGYDNLFAQIIKKYDSVLQEGQQIGMYMKTAQGYKNLMTGEIKSLEEIVKQYGSSGLENLGNKTIADFKQFKNDINTDINIVRNADEWNRRVSYKTRNKEGHVVEEYQDTVTGLVRRRDFYNGEDSILLNHYFTNSVGTGSDGLPIDIIGGLSAEVINREGLGNILRDVFDSVGFDFALKQNKEGVRHMYIWSRSIENLEDFSNVLSDIATKNSVTEMSNIELNAFKVSHLNEFVESLYQYKKAGKNINNFKPWYENLYTKAGNKYILNKYGNVKQIQRLTDAMKNNVSWKELEDIAAENSISSNVKNISDGMKEGNEGELNFTYNERQIKNRILQSKKLQDPLTRRDEIKAILKKEFSQYYSNEKMYEKIMNKLTDFIISFHDKKTGITEGMVEQLGKLYSSIITDPNTLEFINRIDTKENNFFNVLTAKLINQGHERSEFNQAFANYIIAISDELYERTGEKITKISQLIPKKALKDDSPYYNAISGVDQLLQKVEKLRTSKYFSGDARYGLMKSIDSKEISNVVEMLGLVNKEQRDLFFSQGINGKDINIKDKWTKNRTRMRVRDIPKDELQSLINTITFDELKNAGIFDYNFLTQMREGLVDMLTRSTSIDNNLQIQLKTFGDGRISMIPIFNSKTEGNIINLGSIDLDRLRLRGSSGTEAFKEAITHELSHVDKIMKYMQGIDEYVKDVEKRVQGLNTSDRKELLASMHYLMFGDESLSKIYSNIDEKYKDIDMIAQNIWNRFGSNQEGASSLDRFRVAKEVFNDIIKPLEEIITEAYTINAVFGGCPELPKEFNTVLKAIEEKYRLVNTVLNTLEGNGFKDLDEFKSVLYNKQVTTSYDNIFDEAWYANRSVVNEYEESLNFIDPTVADDIMKDMEKSMDLPPEEIDANVAKLIHEANQLSSEGIDLNKLDENFVEGLDTYRNKLLLKKGGLLPETITRDDIIYYSMLGRKPEELGDGVSLLSQIKKTFITPKYDDVMTQQGKFFQRLDGEWKSGGHRKFSDVNIYGAINSQTLPLADDRMGEIISTELNKIVKGTDKGIMVKIDANNLLVGKDVLQSYEQYLKSSLEGKNLNNYIDTVFIDGKPYNGFVDYIQKEYGGRIRDKDFDNQILKVVQDISNKGIPGDIEFMGLVEEMVMNRFLHKGKAKEAVERWNDAVSKKILEEADNIKDIGDVMSLQTYIISRHVLQVLNALGEYSGLESKSVKHINNAIRNTASDMVYTELARRNNFNPVKYILNELYQGGTLDKVDVDNVLTLLGYRTSTDYMEQLLMSAGKLTQKQIDNIKFKDGLDFYKKYLENHTNALRRDLEISTNDIENINKSLGNFNKIYDNLGNNATVTDQVRMTVGVLYNKLVQSPNIVRWMGEHKGHKPKQITSAIEFDYNDTTLDMESILYKRQNANTEKYLIHNDPNLLIRESSPYNLRYNVGIELSKYLDTTTEKKLSWSIYNLKKRVNPENYKGAAYIAVNNIKKTLNGKPITNHINYLEAKGIGLAYRNKVITNVWLSVSKLDTSLEGGSRRGGGMITAGGDYKPVFKDQSQYFNLRSHKTSDEGGVRDFSVLEELRALLNIYKYRNKDGIGIIIESPIGAFQQEPKELVNKAQQAGKDVIRVDGLKKSWNNIFSSFVGRDICARLGIEKDFLNSSQNNIGVLGLIQSRLSDIYYLEKNNPTLPKIKKDEGGKINIDKTSMDIHETYINSLANVISKIDEVLDQGYKGFDGSLTSVFSQDGFKVLSTKNKELDVVIDGYIPTFNVTKVEGEIEAPVQIGFDEETDYVLESFGKSELINGDRWITNSADFDSFYDDLFREYLGESATLTQQTSGPIMVKGHDINGNTVYGTLTLGLSGPNAGIFREYNGEINYYKMFKNGEITKGEYEKLSIMGDLIEKINKGNGIATQYSVIGPEKPEAIIHLVDELNMGNKKIQELNMNMISLERQLELITDLNDKARLEKQLKDTEEELEKISDIVDNIKSRLKLGNEEEGKLGFVSRNDSLSITPTKDIDKKAAIKGSISNKFIGYADGIKGSSTAEYAKQAGDMANVGKYSNGDVVFVSVVGKRGDYNIRHEQQNRTIKEAIKALDEGATLITDSKAYLRGSDYNEGEIRLMNYLYKKGYVYKNVNVDGTIVGSWTKPEGKLTPYEVKKNDFNAKKTREEGKIPAIRRTIEGEYTGPHSFGNPFDGRTRGEYGVKEATNRFYKWIKGTDYQDINPEQREWIVNQIENGSLKGKTIVYYRDTIPYKENDYGVKEYDALHPNHAMVLQRFINGEYKINEGELGFAKSIDELEEDRIIDEALGDMGQVSEEEIKQRGWDITYGDDIIKKDISEAEKEVNKANTFKGVVSPDGETFLPGTKEAEKALDNGGTDVFLMQKAAEYMDYITPQQLNRISSNLFSLSNYDIIESSDILNGIAGHRTHFMDNNKDALQEAIHNFNNLISDYSQADKEKLYKDIINQARLILKQRNNNLHVNSDGNMVTGMTAEQFSKMKCTINISDASKEVNQALRDIGNVFVHTDTASDINPSWSWALQFATLNEKGGFDDLWMRLSSNEFSSTADYLFMHDIATIYNGKDLRTEVAKLAKATGASDGKVERFVHDWFGDSLGTSALYKMDANTKSLYRMMKYSPLSPISGTLMLVQSALLGTAMYLSKRRGLGFIMNMPEFNLLTLPKTETMKINGVEYNGLGWLQSLTREGDISLNSNTDLGRTFVDRMLDKILGIVPMPAKMRETVQTVMKGGMQSIYDICAQDSIKQMALAQALATNGITSGYKFKQFLNALQNGKGSQELISNILGNAEINYSRFFSNSATTVMSRNRFSRRWMFNCMNNYTIIRSDEVIQGILKFRRDWGNGLLNDMSFGEYLLEYNPELKGLMNNMIMATKMGYHFNLMATGNIDNQENLEKYIVDSSDYLSSIPATFFYNILSAPFKGVSNYIDYTNAVGESETFGGAVKEATLQTLSATMSQFFREGKVINVFRDWLIAYAKTNNLDYANTVAGVDLEKIANGLGRFMLVEGTETYGVAALPERGDPIGQILLNSFETNQYGKAKTKLNNIVTAEEYLNGETSDNIVNILAYMPVFGEFIKNATTGQGFTFTQAKYNELEKMVDNDQVIKDLYKGIFDASQYSDASINRLYQDLIKFDYTANRTLGKDGEYKLGSYDAKTGSDTTLNDMKEAVFTKNMLDKLGLTREEFVAKLNKADEGDKKALIKILAMADAAEPGSSRVCLSYLANKYHYELMKNYSGKDYPGGNDLTEEQTNEINRKVVEKYYPDMFVVDKTSWYKAVREYISLANPTVFDTLYKDEDLSGYVNSLGYLDMLMFQFAHEGDVDARYIKNAFSLIGKYVPNTEARVSIMNHTMQTIEDLDTYDSIKTMMKMGVIAGNTDIYDKIKKDELMNIMNPDLLETYENFVWGVDEEINQKGTALAIKELSDKEKKQYKGTYGKKFKYSKYSNGNNQTQDDVQKQAANMFPATQPHRAGNSIKHVKYTPTSFTPTRHSPLYFYIKIYEDTIRETSDKLVTTTGKKYPAQTIEGMTYHGTGSNRGRITARKLEFPERRRRTKNYSTDRWAGYPGG